MHRFDPRVYVILDPAHCAGRDVLDVARACLRGGATLLQLRAKGWSDRDLAECATSLVELAQPDNVPVLVNDRADIALAAGAAGVHVGPGDLPVAMVRRILGRDAIVGASARTPEAALALQDAGADYLGVGALFEARGTKSDASPPRGPEWIGRVRAAGVTIPVVGIGGIDSGNAADVMRHGADGVAVVSAVCAAPDPTAAVLALRRAIEGHRS